MAAAKQRKQRRIISEHIDQTKPAYLIVDKCGGLSRYCEMMGFKIPTVHEHMRNGIIPNPLHKETGLSLHAFIISRAREHGIKIKPEEFIESEALVA